MTVNVKNMVDNFEEIYKLMEFRSEDDFYTLREDFYKIVNNN